MWGKEPRLLSGLLQSLSTRAGSGLAFSDIAVFAVFANLTTSSFGAPAAPIHSTFAVATPNERPLRMPGPHLRLRLLVPSLCSGTWNATHCLRSHSYAHALTHGFPPPTPPSHVHKPGRFPFVFILRASGSPLPWPLSSWVPLACLLSLLPLCPCCALGE